jgi:hypothetical protein
MRRREEVKGMNTKKIILGLSVLLLGNSIVDRMRGENDCLAKADDNQQRLIAPEVDDARPASSGSTDQPRQEGALQPLSKRIAETSASKAIVRRRFGAKSSASAAESGGREAAIDRTIRKVAPWFTGVLGLTGLSMILCSLWMSWRRSLARRVRVPVPMERSEPIRASGTRKRAELALTLVHNQPALPQGIGNHNEEERCELPRAA